MSTITEVQVSAGDFELGRLFEAGMGPDAVVRLETLVPVGDDTVPYFRVRTDRLETLLEAVREGSFVAGLRVVDDYGEESLLALDWEADRDRLFGGFRELEVSLLRAQGRSGVWTFELRFDDAAALGAFREYCGGVGIDPEVIRVYNPTSPGSALSYGVTRPQREALVLAGEWGYYDIPRRCTTADLAAAFGISDQAVSERLRRGTATLVRGTLSVGADE
jgi:hypothetical protein